MSRERAWVETVRAELTTPLKRQGVTIESGRRVPYTVQVNGYRDDGGVLSLAEPSTTYQRGYQTDLLVAEQLAGSGDWVPRVIVECKFERVTTHDALTYSTKAAAHKTVHPYLRYGFVIGKHDGALPGRLLRHGHHFDFMLTLESEQLTEADRARLVNLLKAEVRASRTISALLSGNANARLFHRTLSTSS